MENKSIEQVKEHCLNVGYTHKDMARICGFLVGKGMKKVEEVISFRVGGKTLKDFIEWFESDEFVDGDYVLLHDKQIGLLIDAVDDNFVFFGSNRVVKVIQGYEIERKCTEMEIEAVNSILDTCGLVYSNKEKRVLLSKAIYEKEVKKKSWEEKIPCYSQLPQWVKDAIENAEVVDVNE